MAKPGPDAPVGKTFASRDGSRDHTLIARLSDAGQQRSYGRTFRMVCTWGEAEEKGQKAEVTALSSAIGVRPNQPATSLASLSVANSTPQYTCFNQPEYVLLERPVREY